MPIRPILQEGLEPDIHASESVLRGVALPVPEDLFGTPELADIISDMVDTLAEEPDGVALAAPQIGVPYRIFIIRYDRTLPPDPEKSPEDKTSTPPRTPEIGVFINPQFIRSSRRRVDMDEGCLSVRGIYGTTLRNERATVRARTTDGHTFERGGGGLIAQIYQHETDHLNGILFIDHAVELVHVKKNGAEGATAETPEELPEEKA